jgi:hypothetical protein
MLDIKNPAFEIAPAPRDVPVALGRQLLVGGMVNQMGWAFAAFGLFFCWFFVGESELRSYVDFAGQTTLAQGRVIAIEETSSTENDQRILAVRYAFSIDGREHGGVSYGLRVPIDAGEEVPVEYVPGAPARSRIVGMRRYKFGAWAAFVLVFPLIGMGMALTGFEIGRRKLHTLRHGRPALGTLVAKRATNVHVNHQPVYELTFKFQDDDGCTHVSSISTLRPETVTDDAQERLLYVPGRPSAPPAIALLDELPGNAYIASDGRLIAAGSSTASLILPALFVLMAVALLALGLAS